MRPAQTFGSPALVTLYLAKGAKVDARDAWGKTPLLRFASSVGESEIPAALLAAGADVTAAAAKGDTVLHGAAAQGEPGGTAMVRLWLKHDASPAQPNHEGKTPADVASSDAIRALVSSSHVT